MKKIAFFIFVVCIVGIIGYESSNRLYLVEDTIVITVGENVDLYDNLVLKGIDVEDVTILSTVDINTVGIYEVEYYHKNDSISCTIKVEDTIKPIFNVREGVFGLGYTIDVYDLVDDIEDHSPVIVGFDGMYNFNIVGLFEVGIFVEDAYQNRDVQYTMIEIVVDSTPPVIEPMHTLEINLGDHYNFYDIEVVDDYDSNPVIEVDMDDVDLNQVGTYWIKYYIEDQCGNRATYGRSVVVYEDHLNELEKVVYLTFDDGPSSVTKDVLNVLEDYGVKATFFVTRGTIEYQYLITEAFQSGHAIGLHSYSHDYQTIYSAPYLYFKDLSKIDDLVYDLTGQRSTIVRFPGGSSNTISMNYNEGIMGYLVKEVERLGYMYFDWNISSEDAVSNHEDVQTIIDHATSSNATYVNVLMHDSNTKQTTVEALPSIIEYYLEQGYTFKTLEDCTYSFHHVVLN